MKKIVYITGTRAEYGLMSSVLKEIQLSKELDLTIIVTGMHLLRKHGYTIDLIEKDKIPITKIISMYEEVDSSKVGLGKAVGNSIIKFTEVLDDIKPDLLLILGDRFEALVAVITASTLKIPVGHIHGGDISGTIDENIRHAITKLSHIHFPATLNSAERLRRLGEEEKRIYMVGSPTVDVLLQEHLLDKSKICKKLGLNPSESIILCIQHPNFFESDQAGEQMKITLKVLKDLNVQSVIIYPNNDLGSDLIIQEIRNNEGNPKFKIFENLERNIYLSLLKITDLLIGNSSGGLIETPLYKVPFLNIGTRNEDREKVENVLNVGYDYDEIKNAAQKAFSKEFKDLCQSVKNPYGDGTTSDKIVEILEKLDISEDFLIKKLAYDI